MTVQTTFAGGLNPWAMYFKPEKERRPKHIAPLKIDITKIRMFDSEMKQIDIGEINYGSDMFAKMEPGFTLKCDPKDHLAVRQHLYLWRKMNPTKYKLAEFVEFGQMGICA